MGMAAQEALTVETVSRKRDGGGMHHEIPGEPAEQPRTGLAQFQVISRR
jgi:hypothetical protein